MTRKIILGLAWKIWSPSLYELEARDDGLENGIRQVAVSFGQDHRWWIIVLMKRGGLHRRGPFRSRDEAIGFISGRYEAVSHWPA